MHGERDWALERLRALVIFLVVLLHASISYMVFAPQWWYVLDQSRSLVFTYLVLLVDVPIMLVMFFLAGYFAYPSLQRRGPRAFLADKLRRIGLPWLFGVLVLAPPTAYMIYYSRALPVSLAQFWSHDFWTVAFQQSVYWFLGVLLALFALTAWLYSVEPRFAGLERRSRRPHPLFFPTFLAACWAACLLVGLVYPIDHWSHCYLFSFQPTRVPLYLAYFALGIHAWRSGWLDRDGWQPGLAVWGPLCLLSAAAYLAARMSFGETSLPAKAATIFAFNLFCLAALLAGLALTRRMSGGPSKVAADQARNSYGIYYLHPLLLYPLALAFTGLVLPVYVKAAAVTLIAYLGSWAISSATLTRLPGLRRLF